MHIVLNQENNIIAIDNETLQLFQATNIMELYQKLANGVVEFYIKDGILAIISGISSKRYKVDTRKIFGSFEGDKLIIVKDDVIANREINLKDVVPVRFDFSLEKSSKELELPEEIIMDFIKDFNEKCRIDTQNIIDAYKAKDMKKIYEIAHELRLVASNLFITPLAESLLKLQYNKEIYKVPSLVEKYWTQFISFENRIKNIQEAI
jgi:hypothetical protein